MRTWSRPLGLRGRDRAGRAACISSAAPAAAATMRRRRGAATAGSRLRRARRRDHRDRLRRPRTIPAQGADVIRQQTRSRRHRPRKAGNGLPPRRAGDAAGEPAPLRRSRSNEIWHLTSDRGQVRADGDDVQLSGNVRVTGPAPGSGAPLTLTTERMRINTPTEFIETACARDLDLVGPRTRRRAACRPI